MVQYNPKDWITFIFRFHKSDTFRQLIPMMFLIGFYAYGVAYLEIEYWQLSEKHNLKNLTLMHGTLSFVISLLLVFRTNTAYDRWWEGRKQWGALVNNSRGLAIKMSAILAPDNTIDRNFFRKSLSYFPHLLSRHLSKESTELALDENYKELFSAE